MSSKINSILFQQHFRLSAKPRRNQYVTSQISGPRKQTLPGPCPKKPTRKQPEGLAQGDPAAQGTEEWLLPGVLQSWEHPSSSEPSAQSFSPSHRYSWATHPVPSRQGTCVREQDTWRTGVRGCAGLDQRGGVGVTTRAELFECGVVVVGCGAVILVVKD